MLMPSQSPSSTITIQTLPSDQQQRQREYVDTSNNQKHASRITLRREKSMEFEHNDDDINNNRSNYESTDELYKSVSPAYSIDDERRSSVPTRPARRPIRPSIGENGSISSGNLVEPDPNVFLISSDTNSHNTIRKTKHDVKRFVMYIEDQFGEQKPLHTLSAESLCRYLKHYFENTKKFDGTQYEPDTLRSFLLSIERYLKSKKYEYNLMEAPLFQPCRQVIITKREQWKKLGGGSHSASQQQQLHSKSLLPLLNLKNLTMFDRTKPDGLLLEIYVHISKLCHERMLSLGQLLWGDISLVDEQYLICTAPQNAEFQSIRLHATPTHPSTCPVHAYRLYATHRPPQCNTPQSPFFLAPRASNAHHVWYKTTGVGKNLEQVLQSAVQRSSILPKQPAPSPSIVSPPSSLLHETRMACAKRMYSAGQPLNLSVATAIDEDSSTASPSSPPSNPVGNDPNRTVCAPIWDESVTDILLAVAKQRDTRVAKINSLRTFLEEKLGVVEFLCLYRGFKSEPKLTFHATPWEHYQRFLPVLFTLLALDNTTV